MPAVDPHPQQSASSTQARPRAQQPLACVYLPHFALQLLGKRDPQCLSHPAVVVAEDRPQGLVREVNRLARAARILPGMRYAAALGLCADVRAGVVEARDEALAALELAEVLRRFSPRVEPSSAEPGTFWLDTRGLLGLWPDLQAWADAMVQALRATQMKATVVVGFTRFGTYALARTSHRAQVLATPEAEWTQLQQVQLAQLGSALGLPPSVRDALAMLGISRLGQFLALSADGLRERHGDAAWMLHQRAHDRLAEPLRPELPGPPLLAVRDIEPPDDQRDRLLFVAKGLLVELLRHAAAARHSVTLLTLRMELEQPNRNRQRNEHHPREPAPIIESEIRAAEPTLYEPQWLDLLRLRLDATNLPARAVRMQLQAETVAATASQLRLWQLLAEAGGLSRRNLGKGAEALAQLRAAMGDDAVVLAELQACHLPDAKVRFQPAEKLLSPQSPPPTEPAPLVRRMRSVPLLMPSRPKHEPDGWLLADWRMGNVVKLWGPFRLTGGWWQREVRRDYWWVLTERGDLLWVFFDAVRKGWFLAGEAG